MACCPVVEAKVAKAIELVEPVCHVEDSRLQFQLVMFCIQAKFTYLPVSRVSLAGSSSWLLP